MDYKRERIDKICEELQGLITLQNVELNDWQIKSGLYLNPEEADASKEEFKKFDSKIDRFIGDDVNYWFRKEIEVPKSFDGKDMFLYVMTQKNYWDAVNPQFLVFVNGEAIQGLDVNHRDVLLVSNAKAGDKYTIDLQAYTGRDTNIHEGATKHIEFNSNLVEYDKEINDVYYNLLTPNKILRRMKDDDYNKIKLQLALQKAVNLIDLRDHYSKDFYDSIRKCNEFLADEVYTKLAGEDTVVATCVGHTHIDIAWWWTVAQTRQKVARSFSTVLKYMEEFEDYKFMSSQPQLYKFLKQHHPKLMEKVAERVKEGRWEAEGGMWLEADCNVTSGESLVRQFLHGKKFFKEEFNVDNEILWLPDVFGYSAALPQIMKKSGIKYFMTTKIAWNQYNKLPVDTFWWRGIDGTEIFTHLITTQDEDQDEKSHFTTYNGKLNPVSVIKAWDRYQQKDLNNDVLISFGYGDGGGGPTREMLETAKRMKSGIVGSPKVRIETSKTYFEDLYSRLENDKKVPKWVGELYLEYHRGVYTSMARNKKSNRKCELMLQDVEFLSVFAERFGDSYPKQEIFDGWELILLNQFHDILPGTSIKDVYDVTKIEYEALEEKLKNMIEDKVKVISENVSSKSDQIVVINTLSFYRNDVVLIDTDAKGLSYNGKEIPTQRTHDNKLIAYIESIPSKGYLVLEKSNKEYVSKANMEIKDRCLENSSYKIEFDENMEMSRFYDKAFDRDVILKGTKANSIKAYEDKPMNFDNWDIDIYYKEKCWNVDDVQSVEWLEKGPVRATLKIERKFVNSTIIQKIYFYNHTKRIDFDTYVDWKQKQVLLRVDFPVDINNTEATYDIQFGNLKRATHSNTSWEKAKFEVCAHKWADISETGYGVSLMNDCKYGYSISDSTMSLTLLKSGILPNPVTDQEEHTFVYSIYPHEDIVEKSETVNESYNLNCPLYSYESKNGSSNKSENIGNILEVDKENVIIETVKKAEDNSGIIIRMYESQNKREVVGITFKDGFKKVKEYDLMENEIGEVKISENKFTFDIKPYEIKTFKITI